jgi:hypothetical protein
VAVGASGVAELPLEPALEPGERLHIATLDGEVLLDAPFEDGERRSAPAADVWSFRIGETSVRVRAVEGPLAPPFPTRLSIEVSGSAVPPSLDFQASQAEPAAGVVTLDARGRGELALTPIASPVDLTLELQTAAGRVARQGRFDAPLGAIHARWDVDRREVVLTSPSPREVAFVSLFEASRRIGGSEVQLSRTEDGFFQGRLPLAERASPPTVVSASTTAEDAAVSVWFTTGDATLLASRADGLPVAYAREQARVAAVRRAISTLVSIALGLQVLVVLLLARVRTRAAGATAPDGDYAVVRKNPLREPGFVVVVVLVGVMFAMWGWLLRP